MSVAATLTTKTANEQIALHGVRVTGKVLGTHQHITVEQTYVNLEDEAIEAQYTFPLPAKAAVCEFEVRTGDRTLTGEIDEITNNAKLYDASVEQGDGAFLLEQQRPDIFTAWVGNIKPQQAATIRVTYLAPIDVVERQMRLALPTTVSPRYVTNTGGRDPLSTSIDGIAVNPPHVLHVPYGMEMTLDLEPGMPIRIVDSPSHGVIVSQLDPDRHQRGKRVSLRDGLTAMDRDIVIEVELDRAMVPSGRCAATEDGETFAAITFIPDFDEIASPAPTETVFLVDTSGSMGGSSLQEAKNALELCLRSLNRGDRFNIISFNSYFESFGSRAVSYDADSLARALKWVRDLHSTGGTELFAPLQELLQTEPSVGSVRQVILLTDGQVANEAAVIDLASQSRSQNRFFTFAIGHAASQHLTDGIACATCGAQESIVPGERIEEKVLRTFARLGTPVVENIRVDWGQGVEDVTQAPQQIASVFEGDPLTVFARLRGTPQEVTLSCERAGTPHQWKVPVEMVTDQTQLSRSWAREAIQELAYAFDTPLDRPRVKRRSSREQMIDLSCRYQVVCEHTSFLAIETRADEERTDGNPAHRRVPVQLTAGWGGVET
ncbi:MAG: VIT domain-containing protein, partial [Planctomycetota bacterium]